MQENSNREGIYFCLDKKLPNICTESRKQTVYSDIQRSGPRKNHIIMKSLFFGIINFFITHIFNLSILFYLFLTLTNGLILTVKHTLHTSGTKTKTNIIQINRATNTLLSNSARRMYAVVVYQSTTYAYTYYHIFNMCTAHILSLIK